MKPIAEARRSFHRSSPVSNLNEERVLDVHHWNDSLMSIRTTRSSTFRFRNGQFVMIGLEADGGELHPITRASAALGGAHVCCAASVTDNLEVSTSIPDVCFDCIGFAALTPALAAPGQGALLPSGVALTTAGFVRLASCRSATRGGETAPVGSGDTAQFIVALHGQSVGPFGFAVTGKYSGAPSGQ